MNNTSRITKWKAACRKIAFGLAGLVVLDWLLDGRVRAWLPLRRKPNPKAPTIP